MSYELLEIVLLGLEIGLAWAYSARMLHKITLTQRALGGMVHQETQRVLEALERQAG